MRRIDRIFVSLSGIGLLLICGAFVFAGNQPPTSRPSPDAIHVTFAKGDTEIGTLAENAQPFTDRNYALHDVAAETVGLKFTRRQWRSTTDVTLDIPAGATIYLMVAAGSAAKDVRDLVDSLGWSNIGNPYLDPSEEGTGYDLDLYTAEFSRATRLTLPGRGYAGDIIASKNLVVDQPPSATTTPAAPVR